MDQPQINLYSIIGKQQVQLEVLSSQLKAALEEIERLNTPEVNYAPKSN